MPAYFAERALLPSGWANDVRLEVAADGRLAAIETDASAEGAERLGGHCCLACPTCTRMPS